MEELTDDYLTWKKNITIIEKKVSKNVGLMYRTRRVLDITALKNLCFSFVRIVTWIIEI